MGTTGVAPAAVASLHCVVVDGRGEVVPAPAAQAAVAGAAWSTLATSGVAADLARCAIPVMVLKGPPLQQRLFGTESAYVSADVDLLVPRRQGHRARSRLLAEGWRFQPGNGLLWRLDRAVALERGPVVVDLHWGVHLGPVPAWALVPLERALWSGASPTPGGWWQPRPEPLLVYLALHAAAFGFSKQAGLLLVGGASDLVESWAEVERLARRLRAWPAVEDAVTRSRPAAGAGTSPAATGTGPPPLMTGVRGRALAAVARLGRGGIVPARARQAIRTARDRRRRS